MTDIIKTKFTELLGKFNSLVESEPAVKTVEKELKELKASAERSGELNIRQKEAIVARVDHYMTGIYGKTKRPEHYEHQKPSK